MQEKEVFLKKVFDLKFIKLLVVLIFLSFPAKNKESDSLNDALTYLKNLDEFSSSFLQIQDNDVSEGLIYIKGNRIRIEYTSPSNLVFILKENKGMYYNKELEEVQYFNPKNTIGKFFINLFNNDDFLLNSTIEKREGYFYILKEIQFDDVIYKITIYFEENPFQLRKLEIANDIDVTTFTILNHNYNPDLNDKIFSLANPLLG